MCARPTTLTPLSTGEGVTPNSIFNPAWLVFSPKDFAWQAFNTIMRMIKTRAVQVPTARISPRLQK
jgi:hypothetical protein